MRKSEVQKKDKKDTVKNSDINSLIIKRLDGMLSLMIEQMHQNNMELARIYTTLYQAGFTPTEIGSIVGKPRTTINAMISKYKGGRNNE